MKFCYFADDNLPRLKNKTYSDYKPEPDEWKLLDLIQEVLQVYCSSFFPIFILKTVKFCQEPRNAQASFSSETEPTLWRAIPILDCLQSRWQTLAATPKFWPVRPAILKGIEKLKKWYTDIKDRDTYFICLG